MPATIPVSTGSNPSLPVWNKHATLTDLSVNALTQSALIGTGSDALDASYLITQNGLHLQHCTAYVGSIGGGRLSVR